METVTDLRMENLRKALTMFSDKKFSKIRVSYECDCIEVLVLTLVPVSFRVDENGIYFNPSYLLI